MNKRIKIIRNMLGLNQDKFGEKIGLSKFAISNYENGKTPITERSIADICREFGVSEEWLRYGTGEMFQPQNDDLDYLIGRYGDKLTHTQKDIVIALLTMDDDERAIVDKFMDKLFSMRNSK